MPNRLGFGQVAFVIGLVILIACLGALVISTINTPVTPTPTLTATPGAPRAQGPSPTPPPTAAPLSPPAAPPTAAPTQIPPTVTATLQATSAITPTATLSVVVVVNLGGNTELGPFLVDPSGMTLYTFSQDTPTSSACADACATTWPPVVVAPGTQPGAGEGLSGQLATIARNDGALQVTYNGHPLYRYAQDTAPGDAKGHGVNNQWFVATP